VQANALGGGLEMALVCDLIVVDATARLGLPEVKLGLIPGGGGTQRLTRRVGAASAKRLMLLGSAVGADEALRLGLADVVAARGSARDTALQLAGQLAASPAVAVQSIKRCVDGPGMDDLSAGLERERREFIRVFGSADFREGYTAFLEKRRPEFTHQ
jgi:enoyl-CoA hydratase/carnithine racemase